MTFMVPETNRIREGRQGTARNSGNNGAFLFRTQPGRAELFAVASDGMGWEHVSVSARVRCPTWEEMCWIKGIFWGQEDCVIQFHPPSSQYVNVHPNCLHLWRPIGKKILMPETWLVW